MSTATATKTHYSVESKEGTSFDSSMKMRSTERFVIKHADGMQAWIGPTFWASIEPRRRAAFKAQATKTCKRYDAYLKRTGHRWEVEQKADADAKFAAARAKRDLYERMRTNADKLLALAYDIATDKGASAYLKDRASELIATIEGKSA